jgi:uroporphyrinogen-III synthase
MRRLLVLRPEPGASATVELARKRGLEAVAVPLFEIEPLSWTLPEPNQVDALLLTSANAVRTAGEKLDALRGLPAYAVGQATAQTAREGGLRVAAVGEGGIDELLASIEPGLRLLHLCGEDRREPTTVRQWIAPVPVYRAKPIGRPSDLSVGRGAVAAVHSPRIGRRFAGLMDDRHSTAIAAISRAAADAAGAGWEVVEAAAHPNDEALLALAERLCNTSAPE